MKINLKYSIFTSLLFSLLGMTQVKAVEPSEALKLAQQLNQAFVEVAESVSKSVVEVRVSKKSGNYEMQGEQFRNSPFFDQLPEDFRRFFEQQQPQGRKQPNRSREPIYDGQGSGLVYREDGIIMTNRHVVENSDKIKIVFKDGREYDGEILGVDRESDIAIIKIEATGLQAVKIGDSNRTKAGEFAIAIGSPFGLKYSVTIGHISAKGRRVLTDQQMFDQDFIQTDASINPGNSGGPLVNIYGEVIGINTLIRGMNTGIGFAVPINLAKRISDMLIKDGKVTRAWLGVSITTLREDVELRDLAVGVEDGVVVRQFIPGGPAEKSDLELADIITSVDGKKVKSAEELKRAIRFKNAGDSVKIGLMRDGNPQEILFETGAFPEEFTPVTRVRRAEEKKSKEPLNAELLGMKVQEISEDLAKRFMIDEDEGVIVVSVEKGSVSEEKNISPGDIVTRINSAEINSIESFRKSYENEDLKKGVLVHLKSNGSQRFEVLKDY